MPTPETNFLGKLLDCELPLLFGEFHRASETKIPGGKNLCQRAVHNAGSEPHGKVTSLQSSAHKPFFFFPLITWTRSTDFAEKSACSWSSSFQIQIARHNIHATWLVYSHETAIVAEGRFKNFPRKRFGLRSSAQAFNRALHAPLPLLSKDCSTYNSHKKSSGILENSTDKRIALKIE